MGPLTAPPASHPGHRCAGPVRAISCPTAHHHYGQTLLDAVAAKIHKAPEELTTCVFQTADLELQGEHCSHLLIVLDMPPGPASASGRCRRRDCYVCYVLCDLRALGARAWILRPCTVRAPSLCCGTMRVACAEAPTGSGPRQGDVVLVTGHRPPQSAAHCRTVAFCCMCAQEPLEV